MNKRLLLALYDRSGLGAYMPVDYKGHELVVEEHIEKFAELIVSECIGCCEQVISDPVPKSVDTWLNGGSQCIDQIKQHFGVEE